jgi:choline monooxygenase
VPVESAVAEQWVFARPEAGGAPLADYLGANLSRQWQALRLDALQWVDRRHYTIDCNWKVFVDNYLDGGYHVPHVHRGLDSVLSYSDYSIETADRFCLQSSPMVADGAEPVTGAVRQGDRAYYYWVYPNFMINCYGGAMDTNLVIPRGVDRTEVIFDFYFADVSADAQPRNQASIAVSHQIQLEDLSVCVSVQRGLRSRAYERGRLSVRREAGEHLFHRLLHADLVA